MFTIIGLMLTGMLLGFLLRKQKLSGIHKVITVLIWLLLFSLGVLPLIIAFRVGSLGINPSSTASKIDPFI